MQEEYSRPEHMRMMRAAEARGLRLLKSRARILSATNVGRYQLQDASGRVISGVAFDATLESLAPLIFATPLRGKLSERGSASA